MTHELHLSREGEKEMEALIKEKEKYNTDVTLLILHAPPFHPNQMLKYSLSHLSQHPEVTRYFGNTFKASNNLPTYK